MKVKKILKAFFVMLIMAIGFSGCVGSDEGDNITKEKAQDMVGIWNITVNIDGTNVSKNLILEDVGENEDDNTWAAVGVGLNYVDMAWYDTEDECYYAGTYYEDGSIDGYTFQNISENDTISGNYIYIDENENAYGTYLFTGYRASVAGSVRSMKNINKIEIKSDENSITDGEIVSKFKRKAEQFKNELK